MSGRRLTRTAAILSLIVVGTITWQSPAAGAEWRARPSAARRSAKLHPALVRLTEASEAPVKAWVFFADKGVRTPSEYRSALQDVERAYDQRAIRRRAARGDNAARGGRLFDERDLPVRAAYVQAVAATGAKVHVTSRWVNAVSVHADRAQLDAVADLPFVRALQPVARSRRINDRVDVRELGSAALAGAEHAPDGDGTLDYGLALGQLEQINIVALHEAGATGAGVIIGVLDTGFRRDHVAFNHAGHPLNVIAEYDFLDDDGNAGPEIGDPSAQHLHGTLILGEMAAYMPGELVGAAYDAAYILCKTEDTTAEYPAEEDNYVAGLEFIEDNGGDVVNSSLGYIDWYTQGDLDGRTAVTTIAVNAATANGLHMCTSAGNNGNDADPTTSHLLAPSDAFQVLACGAVDEAGAISSFSSDGPSADGRVKPELLARGVGTFTISANDTTTYNSVSGTSASAPLVTSAVACLVDAHPDWTVDEMRNALIRTAAGFVASGTHDPSFVRGYGVINAYAAGLDCNFNDVLDACDLDCGATGGSCDVPGCGGAVDCNVNGMPDDCEPDCNGNGAADACDIADCDPGDSACQDCNRNGVPDACDVPFPQQGRIELDRQTYICTSTALVVVNDCGLNTDGGTAESVTVFVQSDSEPGGESVLLNETGPDTGVFEGSIALSAADGSGVLLVGHADAVTARYVDSDNGLGGLDITVTDEADVDCNPPVVSEVEVAVPGPFGATVSFVTDEPATATVRYGLSCDALTWAASETSLTTTFAIPLTGLSGTTTYFFAIDVVDAWTNAATYDNDGNCHSFVTPEIPNYYTEYFSDNDNDMDFQSLLFTPDGSADIYAPCNDDILALPTDPTGGNVLNLANVDFVGVPLPSDKMVTLYGVSYSMFYVGAHGYVTFESGDDEFFDTLPHHFNQPRISGLFDFIEPSEGGTVSWKLLADRVAVSWENVPEFFHDENLNTFQIEMYFDGRIGISLLEIGVADGLTGLSAGTGVVPGFEETDLSELLPCGEHAPVTTDYAVTAEVNATTPIQLIAIDDGLPDPPGAMTYTIMSLPEHATLKDPGGDTITSLPYILAGNDGIVEFVPDAWYGGPDAFQFLAGDGGSPPTGGDSEIAIVSVAVGGRQAIHSFDMEVDPGWTTEGQWEYGQPTGGGSNNGDPTSGHTGSNVYGYNLNGDYPIVFGTQIALCIGTLD